MCIFRYMTDQRTVGIEHSRRIVIKPLRPLFKQRSYDRNLQFFRDRAKRFSRRSRNCFRQVKEFRVLFAAKVLRPEELLQTDDLGALGCRVTNPLIAFWRFTSASVEHDICTSPILKRLSRCARGATVNYCHC